MYRRLHGRFHGWMELQFHSWTPFVRGRVCPLIKLELNVLSFLESRRFLSCLIPPLGEICPDFNTKEAICMSFSHSI